MNGLFLINNLQKLEQELVDKKKEMELTIKEAEQAYQAREQAKTDMETLKKEAEKEQLEFQMEWGKLEKLIEQDKQVTNHANKNRKDNSKMIKDEHADGDKFKEDKNSADHLVGDKNADGKGGKKSMNKTKDALNPANSYRNELERIQDYDAGFKSIFEATQINDIDTLIEQFEKAENNNYSLLKYAESLSSDIKELDEEIK